MGTPSKPQLMFVRSPRLQAGPGMAGERGAWLLPPTAPLPQHSHVQRDIRHQLGHEHTFLVVRRTTLSV